MTAFSDYLEGMFFFKVTSKNKYSHDYNCVSPFGWWMFWFQMILTSYNCLVKSGCWCVAQQGGLVYCVNLMKWIITNNRQTPYITPKIWSKKYIRLRKLQVDTFNHYVFLFVFCWFQPWNHWKSSEMNKKGWKTAEKNVSTSWSKYTTLVLGSPWQVPLRLRLVSLLFCLWMMKGCYIYIKLRLFLGF